MYLIAENMLTSFPNGSIIDAWRGPECASERYSTKSYKKLQ